MSLSRYWRAGGYGWHRWIARTSLRPVWNRIITQQQESRQVQPFATLRPLESTKSRTRQELDESMNALHAHSKTCLNPGDVKYTRKDGMSFAEASVCIRLAWDDMELAEYIFSSQTTATEYSRLKHLVNQGHRDVSTRDFVDNYKRLFWAMMWVYSRHGHVQKVKSLLDVMNERNIEYTEFTLIYKALIRSQLYSSFPMYLKIFRYSSNPLLRQIASSSEIYRHLMLNCVNNNQPTVAIRLLKEMLENKVQPDQLIFHMVIEGLFATGQDALIDQFLTLFQRLGLEMDKVIYSHLLNHAYRKGDAVKGVQYLDAVDALLEQPDFEKDDILYNNYIKCCGLVQRPEAIEKAMQDFLACSFPITIHTAQSVVVGTLKCGNVKRAAEWFYYFTGYIPPSLKRRWNVSLPKPCSQPLQPDLRLLSAMVDGTGRAGHVDAAVEWLDCMINTYTIQPNMIVATSLLAIFYHHDRLSEGLKLFLSLCEKYHLEPDTKAYFYLSNSVSNKNANHALLALVKEMVKKKKVPNSASFAELFMPLVVQGNLDILLELQDVIASLGIEPDVKLYTTWLLALLKVAHQPDAPVQVEDAIKRVYQELSLHLYSHPQASLHHASSLISLYQRLIAHYVGQRHTYQAIKVYYNVLKCRILPTETMMVSLVRSLGHKKGWLHIIRFLRKSSDLAHHHLTKSPGSLTYESWASSLPTSVESNLHKTTLACLVGSFYTFGAMNRSIYFQYAQRAEDNPAISFSLNLLTLSSDTKLHSVDPHLFTRQGVLTLWESVLHLYLAQPHHIRPNGAFMRTCSLSDIEAKNTKLTRRKLIVFTMALVRHCQVNSIDQVIPLLMEQLEQATGYQWDSLLFQRCIRRLIPYSL